MDYKVHILAHNEEDLIEGCVRSVLAQSVGDLDTLSVVVIANGCSDGTEEVVQGLCETDPRVSLFPIKGSGKVNALRFFLQEFFKKEARLPACDELLFFMDADVKIMTPGALETLARNLLANDELYAASSFCIPESVYHKKLDFVSCLYRAQFKVQKALRPNIFRGMLYCVRASVLKEMIFPKNLLSDDICLEICLDGHFRTDYEAPIVYKLHKGIKREIRRNFMHCFVVLQAYGLLREKKIKRIDPAPVNERFRLRVLSVRDTAGYLLSTFDILGMLLFSIHFVYRRYNIMKARRILREHGTQGVDYQAFWRTRR